MDARSTLLQVILGHVSEQDAARQLFETCLGIVGQVQHYSIDDPARVDFTAGYNQGVSDVIGRQRTALRAFFGQPEETT